MAKRKLEFHPLAVEEAEAAARWYAVQSETAATRFASALEHALEKVRESPEL